MWVIKMFMFKCDDINFLRNIMYMKSIINIIFIVVPIILIVMLVVDAVKAVVASDDGLRKMWKSFVKRIVAAILVFFVPTMVSLVFSTIENVTNNSIACYNDATDENIQKIASRKATEYFETIDKSNVTLTQIAKLKKYINNMTDKTEQEEYKKKLAELEKIYEDRQAEIAKKEEEERREIRRRQEERKGSGGGGSPKDKTIIVGDSEIVAMCENYKLCENNQYFAKIGEGYYWFVHTAISHVNSIVQSGEYNIVIVLGSNGVGISSSEGTSESEKYFNKVKSLAEGEWKKHNIVYVSVNPCNDSVAASMGYYIKQVAIDAFNKNMKTKISSANLSNLSFCDTATGLNIHEIDAGDGLHYNKKGASQVYNTIKNKCLKK